jgi:hypothetical protein
MSDEKKQYVGDQEVKEVARQDDIDLVGVLYTNGKSEDFTIEQFENVVAVEPYENGLISTKKYEKLMQRILAEMVNARVDLTSHSWILQHIDEIIGERYREAIAKQFGVKHPNKIMLAQIDQVLKAKE